MPMKCSVVRSGLKDFTYIYLRAGHDLSMVFSGFRLIVCLCSLELNLVYTGSQEPHDYFSEEMV
jgi:hypothetical protein